MDEEEIVFYDWMPLFETADEERIRNTILDFNKMFRNTFTLPEFNATNKLRIVNIVLEQAGLKRDFMEDSLETLKILSRDQSNLNEVFRADTIICVMKLAGLMLKDLDEMQKFMDHSSADIKVLIGAQKVLCNLIFNSPDILKISIDKGILEGILLRLKLWKNDRLLYDVKFYDLRLLFLLTALAPNMRPLLITKLDGFTELVAAVERTLMTNADRLSKFISSDGQAHYRIWHRKTNGSIYEVPCPAPCLNDTEVDLICEILKILFNATLSVQYANHCDPVPNFPHLMCVCRDLLLCDVENQAKQEDLHSHTVDLLTNMPRTSYCQVMPSLSQELRDGDVPFEGKNMATFNAMLNFLERRLKQPHKTYKELLAPVLTVLSEASRAHRIIRRFLRSKVLPPLKDVMNRPEVGQEMRNRLVKLMTSPIYDVKEIVADFLFVLCKESVIRLIKYTGYGNAAGLLANRGLMLGGRGSGTYSSDSEDSDTEEYLQYKDQINPIVGCYEEPKENAMADMSDEQKEYEAMELVKMMDKMAREGLVQPMTVGIDGKPHVVNHILELQEEVAAFYSKTENQKDSDED